MNYDTTKTWKGQATTPIKLVVELLLYKFYIRSFMIKLFPQNMSTRGEMVAQWQTKCH